jgi:protein ImuA
MQAGGAQRLSALKRRIAVIEGTRSVLEDRKILPLGVPGIDAALGGGLAFGALHELQPAGPLHLGATFGFALALACGAQQARRTRDGTAGDVLWIETSFATAETGRLHGPGLATFGLALRRVLLVRVARPIDALWVMEEALGCRGIATTIAVVARDLDLTATRRLSLAARDGGALGLLVRRLSPHPSAALTRWQVAAARSPPDVFGGLGPASFDLTLTKNRHGPCGRWTVMWDHHDGAFLDPVPVSVARTARDRSDRALGATALGAAALQRAG